MIKVLLIFCALLNLNAFAQSEIDHAPLSAGHVQDAEDFIKLHLKDESGEFSEEKISTFIKRLYSEREELANDMYETKIIEKLNYNISDIASAKEDAKDELNGKKNAFLKGYDKYLIPKISSLLTAVKEKKDKNVCNGIVQEFVSLYIVYYSPNIHRRPWILDLKPNTALRFVEGFRFKKNNSSLVEANNLMVENENKKQISTCLGKDIQSGTYLTEENIQALVTCGYDISKINPGKSTFWNALDEAAIQEAKNVHPEYFPSEKEQMNYLNVRLSGQGSPKLTGYVLRNGKKVKYKIKLGYEVHTSIAASILSKLMGFHQDTFQPRRELKLYLNETSYENFLTQWRRKYDTDFRHSDIFIKAHGGKKGNEWVILRDIVLASMAEPGIDRLDGYLTTAWDLLNRREHRAAILWLGFLNIIDTKPSNYLVELKNLANGEIEPKLMLQDTGMSLVYGYSGRFPIQTLKHWTWSVNAFHQSFLKYNSNQVTIGTIGWTPYDTTTYNDVKWLARKIASISYEDIKYAFEKAEFPKEVQDLYVHKIANRRNEIVKAFDLDNEFALYPVPDLRHYSPNKAVKNGRIVVNSFEGYGTNEKSRAGWNVQAFTALTNALPLKKMTDHFNAKISNDSNMILNQSKTFLSSDKLFKGISHKGVWGGIGVTFNRNVGLNNSHAINMSPNETQGYRTVDTISVEFNVGSGLFGDLFKDNPLGFDASVQVFKREYTMIQMASSLREALLNPYRLTEFILNNRDNIVFNLHASEFVMIKNSFGVSTSVSPTIPFTVPGTSMSVSPGLSWVHSDPVYFGRDSFGQLFVYKEDKSETTFSLSASANLGLKGIPLFKTIPLLSESFYNTWYNFDSGLYLFELPEYIVGGKQIDYHHLQQEYNAFKEFMDANADDPIVLARRSFTIDGRGRQKRFKFDFLTLFHNQQASDKAKVTYKDANGKTREFIRATYRRNSRIGWDKGGLDMWGGGMTTKISRNTIATVEVDTKELDKSVCWVTDVDYYRHFNLKHLIRKMNQINKQFSMNDKNQFFDGHTLPDKKEVDDYKKLYNKSYVYLNCGKLFAILEGMKAEDVQKSETNKLDQIYVDDSNAQSGDDGFEKIESDNNTVADDNTSEDSSDFSIENAKELKLRKIKILSNIKRYILKYRKNEISAQRLAAATSRLLSRYVYQGGTMRALSEWIGEKNIFVAGEILGLLPSFSSLQSFEAVIERRFTGHSWGGFEDGVPPVRLFIREHLLRPYNFHVSTDSELKSIFGDLPQPDDIEFY